MNWRDTTIHFRPPLILTGGPEDKTSRYIAYPMPTLGTSDAVVGVELNRWAQAGRWDRTHKHQQQQLLMDAAYHGNVPAIASIVAAKSTEGPNCVDLNARDVTGATATWIAVSVCEIGQAFCPNVVRWIQKSRDAWSSVGRSGYCVDLRLCVDAGNCLY
jgi:hypothetical protein